MTNPPDAEPSMDDIERAWLRPKSVAVAKYEPAHVRFVYRWQRTNWKFMKIFAVFWFICVGLMTAFALTDVVGHLGWGYHSKDVFGGLLMIVAGSLAIPFFLLIRAIVSGLTRTIYGPEPAAKAELTEVR